jgi:hypothetical protein
MRSFYIAAGADESVNTNKGIAWRRFSDTIEGFNH